ncbi:MAG: hypothetical protein ABI723_25160 [Bacteroidia bacterium]
MKSRAALRHKLNKIVVQNPLDFRGIDPNCVELYIDYANAYEIISIFREEKNRAKFKIIIRYILRGEYNDDFYKKEDGAVTAMRFSGNPNSRIYCIEIQGTEPGTRKIIIMSKSYRHKNVQKNDNKIKALIKSIKEINYKCYEREEDAKKHK